ncbi:putative membrane protein [Synechococcus sp. MEDNS5]|uniref:hypothetical protein n=1 Tax=Synechococcus sp. MEDNS5 TaxID=1442554 RepID=UPI0016475374|nr:hypothetical protein [Synechococcus sp. MEDNS5]QNJ06902.1 putative membrane protein [Synechococcus sp. MEDNS5]
MALSSDPDQAASAERLPLTTIIPRAWIGFGKAPWKCVGLTALTLIVLTGLGVLARDLQESGQRGFEMTGNALLVLTIPASLGPLVSLLRLADQLLPSGAGSEAEASPGKGRPLRWLLRQTTALVLLEGVVFIGGLNVIRILSGLIASYSGVLSTAVLLIGLLALAAWALSQILALPLLVHHGHHPLAAMEHSRKIVQANRIKVLALLGLLLGVNLIGLMGACLGLLLSIPLSALLLMASCRTQTPWDRDSRRNMLPT